MKNAKKLGICLMALIVLTAVIPLLNVSAANRETVYSTSFETDADFLAWHFIDADGDTKYWDIVDYSDSSYEPKDGTKMMRSKSYDGGPLTPDNLAVGPVINLPSVGSGEDFTDLRMTWYDCADSQYMPNEKYSVYIYECKESDPTDEELKNNSTLLETIEIEKGGSQSYNFREISLNDYQNRSVRIIFRHNTVTAQRCLKIDMITVEKYCSKSKSLFSTSFEADENMDGWLYYDGDKDGLSWEIDSQSANQGSACMSSWSYLGGDLNSNNFLISPKISIDEKYGNLQATWYAGGVDIDRFNETYSVYVYNGAETAPDKIAAACVNSTDSTGADYILGAYRFREYTLDLDEALKSLGNPQNIRLVFRHHDCKGSFYGLLLDDVSVTGVDKRQIIDSGEINAADFEHDMSSQKISAPDISVSLKTALNDSVSDYAIETEWYKTGDENKEKVTEFDFDTEYSADVTVTINETAKYLFGDTVYLTRNDTPVTIDLVDESKTSLTFTLSFNAVESIKINTVSLESINYQINAEIPTCISIPEDESKCISVIDGKWEKAVDGNLFEELAEAETVFMPGITYRYCFTLEPVKGYVLSDSCSVEVDNATVSRDGNTVTLTYSPLETEKVRSVSIRNITAPKIKEMPSTENISVTCYDSNNTQIDCSAEYVWLKDNSGWSEETTSEFEANNRYRLSVKVKLDPKYEITEYTDIHLGDGIDATVVNYGPTINICFDTLTQTAIGKLDIGDFEIPSLAVSPSKITASLLKDDGNEYDESICSLNSYWVKLNPDGSIPDEPDEVSKFEEGGIYAIRVEGSLNSYDYILNSEMTTEQEGFTIEVAEGGRRFTATRVFEKVEKTLIERVELNSSVPRSGNEPQEIVIVVPDDQTALINGKWFVKAENAPDEDYVAMGENGENKTFAETIQVATQETDPESGEPVTQEEKAVYRYSATISLANSEIYRFDESTKYILSGEEVSAIPNEDGTVDIVKDFGAADYKKLAWTWEDNRRVETYEHPGTPAANIRIPDDPQREGYSFIGWQGIPESVPENDDTIIKAEWTPKEYTITFDLDGGEGTNSSKAYFNSQVTPNNPDKEGYTFTGWIDSDGNKVDLPITMPAKDITIKATWSINQYTVSFNTCGGSEVESITRNYGEDIIAPVNPGKLGHTFAGWLYANGTEVTFPIKMPAENITLTAQWQINQYTITFADTGDSVIAPIKQYYGTAITAPEDPTKTGYTFSGWDKIIPTKMPAENVTIKAKWKINQYTIKFDTDGGSEVAPITQDYGTAVTAPENPTKIGYTFDGWDVAVPATMPAGNMTITAKWKINQYTITFDTDGGSVINPITQDYGTEVTVPPSPTKTGHTFYYWVDENNKKVEFPISMPENGLKLKAIWVVVQFELTIDYGYDGIKVEKFINYGGSIEVNDPTREGYTFSGWIDSEGNKVDLPITMPAKKVTITAQWTINKYKVTWNVDGVQTVNEFDFGSTIIVPKSPQKEHYVFKGWTPEIPDKMPAKDLVFTAVFEPIEYTVSFIADGKTVAVQKYTINAQVIDVPTVPKKTGYSGIWEQYSLNGGNKVVNAIYTLIAKPEIRNFRSERTEKYKTTITFAAKYDNMLPDNSSIHWFINGRDVGTGAEYTVKNATGDFTVQVKLIAQNGEILHESQIESVKIKTGFFDKLVAFFQGLFGSLPRVTQ